MKGKGMLQKNGVRNHPGPVAFLWRAKQSVWLAGSDDTIMFVRLWAEPSDQRGRPSSCGVTEERLSVLHTHDRHHQLTVTHPKQNSSWRSRCYHREFPPWKETTLAESALPAMSCSSELHHSTILLWRCLKSSLNTFLVLLPYDFVAEDKLWHARTSLQASVKTVQEKTHFGKTG